jgi:hypothetical protein
VVFSKHHDQFLSLTLFHTQTQIQCALCSCLCWNFIRAGLEAVISVICDDTHHILSSPSVYMHCVCVCVCVCGLFVTLCVTCNFGDDARVRISKNTFKKPLTTSSLQEPDQWQLELLCPADARPAALIALAPFAVVLANYKFSTH